ncbi:hypothetical protein PHB09_110 [Pseudomonas phage PHB09]|uniref:Uncharacterized protein n=1 Tax=Pseudomonas phage PHB09 TaxID=2867265 RepID=A0AAE8XCD7_9CAUD|nr:hypothetical protein QGX10_gp109 [Pseudomonas phage PHB09]UAV84605.1 hypothetical protein PHB09_110 [Pseudomonas phage PHB09]
MLKRYDVEIETSQGYGMYSGDEYHDLVCRESKSGEWVKAKEAVRLEDKIVRMQRRIDQLEGRI